jgi:hypothetical protein
MGILKRKIKVEKREKRADIVKEMKRRENEEFEEPDEEERFPLNEEPGEEVDEDSTIMKMIDNKRDMLSQEKTELKALQTTIQGQLKNLENKIKQHGDEIQALEYVASGEPTMTIADILDVINDFKNDRDYKTPKEALDAMEKTILKSTLESIQQP